MSSAGGWRPAGTEAIDPHAAWAVHTRLHGAPHTPVPLLLELAADATPAQRRAIAACVAPPGVYDRRQDRFWTGRMAPAAFGTLAALPGLRRWRIGLAATPRAAAADTALRPPQPRRRDGPWVGVIDHGIAFAQRAFRDDRGRTRIAAFWDQQQAPGGVWRPVAGLAHGAEIDAATIDAELRRDGFDEAALYRRLGYAAVQPRAAHGTHVLDLLAGRPDPRVPLRGAPSDGLDAASRAPIVAVQLPYLPVKDTSGQSLLAHVLDALHYIVARAPRGREIVVNLSDGAYGGPHDGGSLLEAAIDDFLARHPKVQLVLAAGNAHELRLHAAGTVAPGSAFVCDWQVPPEDPTDSFVEVWIDAATPTSPPLAARGLSLRLQPPGGVPAVQVALGDSAVLGAPGRTLAGVWSCIDAPNGPGRSQFLIALGPTSRPASAGVATVPHGVWRITVEATGTTEPVAVNAWVERDDPALGDRGPRRQSVLLGEQVTGVRTLGSVAGCARAVVVGARHERGKAFSGARPGGAMTDETRYSSRGPGRSAAHPQRRDGVDAHATGDESPVLHGVLAAGNRSGTQVRMAGTSVAAPQWARRLLNEAAAR